MYCKEEKMEQDRTGGEKIVELKFNRILFEEMGREFALKPLPVDPDYKLKYPDADDKSVYLKNELFACGKTGGIRMGEMNFGGSMIVHFGSVQPAKDYDFPVLGFTFACSSRFLIVVLDLHPVSKDNKYMEKYIAPLKDISRKYAWIPQAEGGRSELHDWAKIHDSGYSLYRWCDPHYVPDVEEAFREYVKVFCACIKKAEPITDPEMRLRRDTYIEKYREDYITKDPGSAPLQHYFGEKWGERYLREFLFGA